MLSVLPMIGAGTICHRRRAQQTCRPPSFPDRNAHPRGSFRRAFAHMLGCLTRALGFIGKRKSIDWSRSMLYVGQFLRQICRKRSCEAEPTQHPRAAGYVGNSTPGTRRLRAFGRPHASTWLSENRTAPMSVTTFLQIGSRPRINPRAVQRINGANEIAIGVSIVRVLVVEDFEGFRDAIRSLLSKHPGLQVVGEVSDGLEAGESPRQFNREYERFFGQPPIRAIQALRASV
jgi:hypothetical protein